VKDKSMTEKSSKLNKKISRHHITSLQESLLSAPRQLIVEGYTFQEITCFQCSVFEKEFLKPFLSDQLAENNRKNDRRFFFGWI